MKIFIYKIINLFNPWRWKSYDEKFDTLVKEIMGNSVFTIEDIVSYDINTREGFAYYKYEKKLNNFNYTYTKFIFKPFQERDIIVTDNIWTLIEDVKYNPDDLDTILDKINEYGIDSLNVKEIKYLDNYEK